MTDRPAPDAPETRTPSVWGRFFVVYWQVVLGAILISAGFAAIFLGWWYVSGNPIVSVQLTYLASGGVGGVALVLLGSALLVVFNLSRQNTLLVRLVERSAEGGEDRGGVETTEVRLLVVPEGAKTYHRPDCVYADGKPSRAYPPGAPELDRLKACAVCEPPA